MGIVRFGRGFATVLLGIGLFPDIARAGFFDFLFPQFQAPAARPFEPRSVGPRFYRHSFRNHKLEAPRKVILSGKTPRRIRKVILADNTNHLVRPYTLTLWTTRACGMAMRS
jgi:hypothetical protein